MLCTDSHIGPGRLAGLNRTLPILTSDIVTFSDANAMYEPDVLRKLARNFADDEVGCVTGEARYIPGGRSDGRCQRARLLALRNADQAP